MNSNWHSWFTGDGLWAATTRCIVIFYVFLIIIGVFYSEKMIFPYSGSSYGTDLPGLQMLEADDGAHLASGFWKAEDEKYLVLYFHGNAEDIGHLDVIFDRLNKRGFSVMSIDYRGYGLSEGKVTEKNAYVDGQALYQEAIEMGYQPEHIIFWGRSVGGGVATELAMREKSHALVLESPFASAFRVMTKVPILPFDKFNNLKKISKIDEPLFILHGSKDVVIPEWHSRKLFENHSGKKERHLIEGAGHNDLWLFPLNDELDALDQFLEG